MQSLSSSCAPRGNDRPAAFGRRYSQTAGGTTTQFLSSGSQIWLEAVGGSVTATYTYGNSLVRKDSEYPMFDGLGSERTVTNGSQTVVGTITFEGFGATIATTGSSASPYLFAATSGYRTDGDAGLMHVGARYYDPQVGRFITRDTELDEHPYLNCDHDPVNHLDPDGHSFNTGPSPQQQEEDRKNRKRRGHTIESGGWGLIGGGTVIVIGGVVASPVVLPMIGIGVAVATGGAIIKWIGGQMQR